MRVKWPENIRELLASEPDRTLGIRLGVARSTIFRLRQRLGIRCFKRPSITTVLQGLVDAVEGSKYPKDLVLVQAIQAAKLVLKGNESDERDRSVC